VKRRSKKYPYRSDANIFFRTNDVGKRKEHHRDDKGGEGWEIIQEILVCPVCAARTGKT
jgi:hypothetical protein